MNCKTAKSIDIVAFLQKIGIEGKLIHSRVWYCSPLRDEKTESFIVDPDTNRWRDFGTGQSGDILDLVKLMYNTDTPGSLEILSGINLDQFLSFSRANAAPGTKEPGLVINHIQPIANKALIQYLNDRKISLDHARLYTDEAYYTVNNKRFFSLAFRNDKGGFELRNPYYKNCTSPKYYTTIQGTGNNQLNLFEGFFDFLSALEYYQVTKPEQKTIVLNSLSFIPDLIPFISKFEQINLYLDNDKAGQEAAQMIELLNRCTVNKSKIIYPLHKDFNEFLLSI